MALTEPTFRCYASSRSAGAINGVMARRGDLDEFAGRLVERHQPRFVNIEPCAVEPQFPARSNPASFGLPRRLSRLCLTNSRASRSA